MFTQYVCVVSISIPDVGIKTAINNIIMKKKKKKNKKKKKKKNNNNNNNNIERQQQHREIDRQRHTHTDKHIDRQTNT